MAMLCDVCSTNERVLWMNITAKMIFFFCSDVIIFANLKNVFMHTPTKHLRCGEYLSDGEKETFKQEPERDG